LDDEEGLGRGALGLAVTAQCVDGAFARTEPAMIVLVELKGGTFGEAGRQMLSTTKALLQVLSRAGCSPELRAIVVMSGSAPMERDVRDAKRQMLALGCRLEVRAGVRKSLSLEDLLGR
ncbi:MAG: hypothetical protein KC656_35710, partial [Myxococcales bacterium]|nr:hypothetical protein [Myxococcales bacterium]